MATSSGQFHEAAEDLRAETRDRHRAVVSLSEELEAVDWYDQRVDATGDDALREILRHNRDEEKEHAAMLLEWLRRRDPRWDALLRRYLFTERPIAEMALLDASPPEVDDANHPPLSLPIGGHSAKEML
jgi:ferritin-like protein